MKNDISLKRDEGKSAGVFLFILATAKQHKLNEMGWFFIHDAENKKWKIKNEIIWDRNRMGRRIRDLMSMQ